jgi:hypothetical protein
LIRFPLPFPPTRWQDMRSIMNKRVIKPGKTARLDRAGLGRQQIL